MDNNKNTTEFLNYYTDDSNELDYAILIKGCWGSGKTYFIKNYFKTNDIKAFYISLYGVSCIKDIEEQFFQQLYPNLVSNKAKISGKIISSAAKYILRSDVLSEISSDFKSMLEKAKDAILIIDDLERCSITNKNP